MRHKNHRNRARHDSHDRREICPQPFCQRSSTAWRITAFLWLISGVLPAVGQQPRSLIGNSASVEQLQARLEALRLELKQEQAAESQREQRHANEIKQLRERRRELADRLLTAQMEREQNADRLHSLREQAAETKQEADQLLREAATMTELVGDAAEQLRVHLQEIPGSEESVQRLSGAVDALNWSVDTQPGGPHVAALATILAELGNAHNQAMRVTVRTVNIYTASSRRETVKLLSLGHVRFAYETIKDNRVGLALASPSEASGYRWAENLGDEAAGLIRDAIKSVESRRVGLLELPIDPTGRVRPETVHQNPNLLEKLRTGGLVMWPLAGLAAVALSLIVERIVVFYGRNGHGDRLAAKVMNACRRGQYERALEISQNGRGAVSRVLAACLGRRAFGQRAMEDSVQEQLLQELPRLNRFLAGIATLAAVAPLLGLLGTVTGIIRTFGVIRAFGNANPSLMAGGISEALLTTASGLVIAVPILIAHSVLRGRSERIVADAERHAAMLLMSLVHTAPGADNAGDSGKRNATANKDKTSSDQQPAEVVAANGANDLPEAAPRDLESETEATCG